MSNLLNCIGKGEIEQEICNLTWLQKNFMLASCNGDYPQLMLFSIKLEGDEVKIETENEFPCEDVVYDIVSNAEGSLAAVQLIDGNVLKFDINALDLVPWDVSANEALVLSNLCSKSCIYSKSNGEIIFLGLTDRNRLYYNNTEIRSDVTSFELHSDFLLMTTQEHVLISTPLDEVGKNNENDFQSKRSLERGSKLILAVSKNARTVLQMPRGNLETVQPRALTLHIVKDYLDELNYKEALEILRRERINLNLIVDHDPQLFMDNIEKFLEQVQDINRLCLFISDLQ